MKTLLLAAAGAILLLSSACTKNAPLAKTKSAEKKTLNSMPRAEKKMAQSSEHIDAHAVFHECRAGETCKASFTVVALKGTHINKEYPHRFSTVEGVPVDFKSSKMEFSSEEKASFITTFEGPDIAMPIDGTLALSACDEKACFIEKLSFAW